MTFRRRCCLSIPSENIRKPKEVNNNTYQAKKSCSYKIILASHASRNLFLLILYEQKFQKYKNVQKK